MLSESLLRLLLLEPVLQHHVRRRAVYLNLLSVLLPMCIIHRTKLEDLQERLGLDFGVVAIVELGLVVVVVVVGGKPLHVSVVRTTLSIVNLASLDHRFRVCAPSSPEAIVIWAAEGPSKAGVPVSQWVFIQCGSVRKTPEPAAVSCTEILPTRAPSSP